MPLCDLDRIADDRLRPRLVELWFALQALRSVAGFLQSGAHPDDETSAMLAALRFRDGLSLAYACSTRGEGGQNDVGSEVSEDLGTIRTAEMERAAERLDMRLWWLSETPEDTIFDFGFSKSGKETLIRWRRDRALARFVAVVRQERPDILCPTFLDVPGQHGHHRAMTELAHDAIDAAADPAFASALPPWRVSKLYLPAWGGGGSAYDDEVPPPAATVTVPAAGLDPVTGWSYARIAQQSRACHRTQGMGSWVAPGAERDWPLHLARSEVGADSGAVTDNLPTTLADLGLPKAQAAVDEALGAFPDGPRAAAAAARALSLLREGIVDEGHRHRVARKAAELARVLRLAAGVEVRGRLSRDWLAPGDSADLIVEQRQGEAESLSVAPLLPEDWRAEGAILTAAEGAGPADPYPVAWDPLAPARPALGIRVRVRGVEAEAALPLEVPPLVLAERAATLAPAAALVNLARPVEPLAVRLSGLRPEGAEPAFALPEGWRQGWSGTRGQVTPASGLPPGLYELPLTLDGRPALTERRFAHPHIAPRLRAFPATLRLRAVEVALPTARIGYVGGGNDDALAWIKAMGCDVTPLGDAALADPSGLDDIEALLVGVFAFRTRPALAAGRDRLRAWVEAGGTLVTLYHRPRDGWEPEATPPRPIEIGQPSLRWRVTDENAAVTHLAPEHPVLTAPNRIGPADWDGWHKERGLYFAKSWDAAYTPLLEMADPGESPHRGALLSAEIGRGRHSHVALGLHHQMGKLTPGAFRLMANLLAPR